MKTFEELKRQLKHDMPKLCGSNNCDDYLRVLLQQIDDMSANYIKKIKKDK